jgi:hypothetical protein
MKYLTLYEAFKSKGISNTIKFIKEKIGKLSAENFINSLKDFMERVDYPIDNLSDDDIKYLSAKKALLLKNEDKVTNEKGIWVIKYWFSLEQGFLGFSATGNQISSVNDTSNSYREPRPFSQSDLERIKERVTTIGEIWPVTDYSKLKTGDTVIGKFDNQIGLAKIFVDERDNMRTYAIQNVASGSNISGDTSWRQWTQYGNLTWWIYTPGDEIGNDHNNLHYYKSSDEELHYIKPPIESDEKDVKEQDPLEYNLPLTNRFSFSRWGRGSSISKNDIELADFALVLYYDDLINPEKDAEDFEPVTDTKRLRRRQKEGATKFLSDDEIKTLNIEKYIQKLSVSLNITETEFFNLEKIVSKHLAGEFSFISIYMQRPDWTDISDFTERLYYIVDSESESDKSYYLDSTKNLYQSRTKYFYEQLLKYQKSKSIINKYKNPLLVKTFNEIYRIGKMLNDYFTKIELNSIDDLYLVRFKIRSVYEFIRLSRNQLSYGIREIISASRNPDSSSFTSYLDSYGDTPYYGESDHKSDMEKLKSIETFIIKLTK